MGWCYLLLMQRYCWVLARTNRESGSLQGTMLTILQRVLYDKCRREDKEKNEINDKGSKKRKRRDSRKWEGD